MIAASPPTRLVLLGHPVAHSLSPRFQNAALEAAGLTARYRALDVTAEQLPVVLRALALEEAGGNVTIPHKEAVAQGADRLSPLARRVGAVNTFWFDHGALVGHNTDVAGVEGALAALVAGGASAVRGRRCAVLGAGGSAAAVLVALEQLGAGVVRVWNRTPERATALIRRVGVSADACESAEAAVRDASIVINASAVGLNDDAMPVAPEALSDGTAVLDLVYRHDVTPFVRACRARGLAAQDGLCMLVEQGAAAFTSWFGRPAPLDAMWGALRARA